jgi:insulysin
MFKKILIPILACIAFNIHGELPYDILLEKGNLPILTPAFKEQSTAKIRLKNGLEAFLISDPNAQISGAMLSVKVGSWEDPKEHPGLAHFLEHMLFMGTRSYPDESEYSRFISENGGQTNAFTTSNTTNYLYTVENEAFGEAFKRFADFFKEPLFNPSGISRELKAIDQEYAKNIENDSIRQLFVLKALTDPLHPFHGFNMGNSQTLANTSRETLKRWYQEHYSAHLMRLVVYSTLPIEELKQLVVSQLQEVPLHSRKDFTVSTSGFPKHMEGEAVYIEPVQDKRTLSLYWELPPKFALMTDTKPHELVSFILGHEGEKSLLAQLKREKLAESLSAGGIKLGNYLFVLYLQIELTEEGLRDVDQAMTRVFQAIQQLQNKKLPQYLFDEVQTMQRLEYQYQSKENEFYTLLQHGYHIQDEDMTTYPEKTKVIQSFDPIAFKEMLSFMKPEKSLIFVMAPSKLTGVKPEKKEPWLDVDYAVKPLAPNILSKWKHLEPHPEIDIPSPNPFIPEDMRVITVPEPGQPYEIPHAKLIINDSVSSFYYAQDTYFGVPKISWTVQVKTPQITLKDPLTVVYADIYIKLIEDALNKFSYPAKMAELEYKIERKNNGIEIKLNGYSENARYLYEEILHQLISLEPTPEKFKIYKDSLARQYHNFSKSSPLEQSIELFRSILYETFVTEKEKESAIRKVNFKKFSDWLTQLYNHTYLEGMFYGNLSEKDARDVAGLTREAFYKGVYPKEDQLQDKVIVLPETDGPLYLESRTKAQGNAVLLAVETPTFSFKERAAQQILMQAIKQPFFHALRTKQQTGYIVDSAAQEAELKLFNLFVVQSNTHDSRDLLFRFEAFIESFIQEIGKTELTKDQFETIRISQIKILEASAKNIKEMGKLLNELAFKYEGNFNWINKRIEALQTLEYSEFIALSSEMLGRDNKQRLGILLNGDIPDRNVFCYKRARTANLIRKASGYESSDIPNTNEKKH